jgi:predicted ArsR family transcriptional regulator
MARRRLSVQEAADVLGTSVDAVRSRVRRGSIASEKGEDGRVYVWLVTDESNDKPQAEDEGRELVAQLLDQVHYLREQLRREQDAHAEARRIIAALTQRIPELEASSEPRGSSVATEEEPSPTPAPASSSPQTPTSRPWWRRIFGEGG